MPFGQVLETVRTGRGETQEIPAKVAHISPSMLSKVEKGTRTPTKEVTKSLVAYYDSPELYIAAQSDISDGASVPYLDRADLHKSTTHLKAQEETKEAFESLGNVPITKRKDQLTTNDLSVIEDSIMEQIEAITALMHNVAILCKEYGFSWMRLWRKHRMELKEKGYLN